MSTQGAMQHTAGNSEAKNRQHKPRSTVCTVPTPSCYHFTARKQRIKIEKRKNTGTVLMGVGDSGTDNFLFFLKDLCSNS